MAMSQVSQTAERTARRVRHETKTRLLQVRDVSRITPQMVRIVVGGDALAGFISAAHDDHVKLFFPQPGQDKPVLPTPSPNGPVYPEGALRPAARDYTPRRYDAAANTLDDRFRVARRRPGHDLGGARAAREISSASAARAAPSSSPTISIGTSSPATKRRCRRSAAGWRNCRRAAVRS